MIKLSTHKDIYTKVRIKRQSKRIVPSFHHARNTKITQSYNNGWSQISKHIIKLLSKCH